MRPHFTLLWTGAFRQRREHRSGSAFSPVGGAPGRVVSSLASGLHERECARHDAQLVSQPASRW
jgi:hypothetical protein